MNDLFKLFLGLVTAGDIGKRHLGPVVHKEFCLALCKAHHLVSPALHVVYEVYPYTYQKQCGKQGGKQCRQPGVLWRRNYLDLNALLGYLTGQSSGIKDVCSKLLAGFQCSLKLLVVYLYLGNFT
ncbi:hypothetical protein SDC9_193521 [bioreactor metagenome]|uniref:Uncharacterized protein n=1 Tax=bioreactor metagenome TaxID=1076179 RepID=A0A645I5A3_9ZZZZ